MKIHPIFLIIGGILFVSVLFISTIYFTESLEPLTERETLRVNIFMGGAFLISALALMSISRASTFKHKDIEEYCRTHKHYRIPKYWPIFGGGEFYGGKGIINAIPIFALPPFLVIWFLLMVLL